MIYLDYASNTPTDERVLERFCETERACIGNANSIHRAGRDAKEIIDRATQSVAELLGVMPEEIIYTSGASEANNLAIKGIARTSRHIGKHIISTPLEHASVSGCLTALQEQGYEIDLVDITREGKVDLDHLRELLRKDTVLVAVTAVDSELGTIQPIPEIAELVHSYPNCHLHVDATQAIGKTRFDFSPADTCSFAPHKFYGLNGIGVLVKRRELVIEPLIHGGVSTTIYRSGTPTPALVSSLECALTLSMEQFSERLEAVQKHNTSLRKALSAYPKVRINSPSDAVPHILNLSIQGVKGGDTQQYFDDHDICVSVKSACSVEGTPSRAVFAVSRDRKNAMSSWRISLSHLTAEDELDQFLQIFDQCYKELVP